MRSALITNTAAVSMMVLTYSTSAALHTIDPWYATLINMPVGAQVFTLLLFGYWVVPGLLLGTILSYIIFPILSHDNGLSYDAGAILVDCLAPVVALYSMHLFKLASFFTADALIIRHAAFYVLLTAFTLSTARYLFNLNKGTDDETGLLLINFAGGLIGPLVLLFIMVTVEAATKGRMKIQKTL
ncbi:MAG TPA: hypothetical protein EYG22_03265 [Candidatus Thioglobus sp.]|nr:hypothetical protein [Candidatus Thioglobus sp.]HIL20613.1 hypothetical protein [Candidatus Thioglobus sp.]